MANEKKPRQQDNEAARRKKEEQARRARRRNRQLLGLVLSILIIWGAVSIVQSAIGLAQELTDDTEERLEYQERIQLFVRLDVLPFESVSQLDDEVLKQLGIWSVYQEQGDNLPKNEYGESLVPAVEVDRWAQRIFGPTFQFGEPHGYFEETGQYMEYIYLDEEEAYILPATSLQPPYLPSVAAIERMSGGYRRVVVGYIATSSGGGVLLAEPDYENPVRYMDFIFRREGSEYYLARLERNTTWEVSGAEEEVASTVDTPAVVPGEDDDALPPPEEEEDTIREQEDGEEPSMEDLPAPDDGAEEPVEAPAESEDSSPEEGG